MNLSSLLGFCQTASAKTAKEPNALTMNILILLPLTNITISDAQINKAAVPISVSIAINATGIIAINTGYINPNLISDVLS